MTTSQAPHIPLLKRLVSGLLLLNLLVTGIVCFSLQSSKANYEEKAAVTTQNLSRVLDEDITGVLAKVDIALQSVSDEATRLMAEGAGSQDTLNNFILRQHSRLPELITFRATNAAGDAVYGAKSTVASTTSLAHREYFKLLRDTPDAGMVVSKPVVGGISGKWMIIIARRINHPDGTFAGLVYAGLGLDYLTQIFKELDVGAQGAITLLEPDLSLVARYPEPKGVGSEFSEKIRSRQLLDHIKSGATSVTYKAASTVDGIERVFSCRRLSHRRPFYIVTGLSSADYLAGWRDEVLKTLLLWAAFCLSTGVSARLLYREMQKTRAAQQSLLVLNGELEERIRERTAAAEKSSQNLQSIVENMSDWVWEVNDTGQYTYCSPQVELFLGYSADEMIGKTPFEFMTDEETLRLHIEFGELSRHKLRIKNLENECIAKDGHRVTISTNAVPILDEAGNLSGYRGVVSDITERKQAEKLIMEQQHNLMALNVHLKELVEEESAKNRSKDLLLMHQEKLASIGKLAAGVAHEINNPMAFIAGNLGILAKYFHTIIQYDCLIRKHGDELAAPAGEVISRSRKSLNMEYLLGDGADLITESLDGAERVSKIVRDLKGFSRVDALEQEMVNMTSCLESALTICYNDLKYLAVINKEYMLVPDVYCNPGQLNQVFLNLLVNAGHAITPPGEILLRSWHDEGFVYASVSDNGKGIPDAIMGRIFEPFFTTKDVGKGTGLGLSVSYEIVKKHQGELLVESKSGSGSTFTVKLPRYSNDPEQLT
jgi:two-component system, cell cycle sensor histidine kinase and response regulator CckA